MGEGTTGQNVLQFTKGICRLNKEKYLNRRSTSEELQGVVDGYEDAKLAGCVDCMFCMKLVWKNFSLSEKGQYRSNKESQMAEIVWEGL